MTFLDIFGVWVYSRTKIISEKYNLPILTDGGILPDDSEMNDPRIMKLSKRYDRDMKLNLDDMVNLSLLVVHSLIYIVSTLKWCFIRFSHWNILCKMYCLLFMISQNTIYVSSEKMHFKSQICQKVYLKFAWHWHFCLAGYLCIWILCNHS